MFYERFIQLCNEKSEKPTTVLKSIGVSSGNLNNWKNGASVKSDILVQLSEHFNVSTDYLLGRTNDQFGNSINATNSFNENSGTQNLHQNNNISKPVDETIDELVNVFRNLSFSDKVKVMSLIAQLSEK